MQELYQKYKIVIFDIEGEDFREYAFKFNGDKVHLEKRKDGRINMNPLSHALNNADIIVGHNIRDWDKRLLKERKVENLIIPDNKIWDTLEIELLLARDLSRRQYKLNTSHTASDDVVLTGKLFFSQISYLVSIKDSEDFNECVNALSGEVQSFAICAAKSPIGTYSYEENDNSFFLQEINPLHELLPEDSIQNNNLKTLIISPQVLWPVLLESDAFCYGDGYSHDIQFISRNNEVSLAYQHIIHDYQIPKNSSTQELLFFTAISRWEHEGIERPIQLPEVLTSFIVKHPDCLELIDSNTVCLDSKDSLSQSIADFDQVYFIGGEKCLFDDRNVDELYQLAHEPFEGKCIDIPIVFPHQKFFPVVLSLQQNEDVSHEWIRRIGIVEAEIPDIDMQSGKIVVIGNDDYSAFSRFLQMNILRNAWETWETKKEKIKLSRQIELALRDKKTIVISCNAFLSLTRMISGSAIIYFDCLPSFNTAETGTRLLENYINGLRHYASQLFNQPYVAFLLDPKDSISCKQVSLSWPESIRKSNLKKAIQQFSSEIVFQDLEEWIRITWGYATLKEFQNRVLSRICEDNSHNYLALAPTGAGKSVVFQALALYRKMKFNIKGHLTIVVTPLQALMQNQVQKIIERFPEIKDNVAAIVNRDEDDQSYSEVLRALSLIEKGDICLLYISPERFRNHRFIGSVEKFLKRKENQVDMIVFDEAHCISLWGADFRPDYIYAARKSVDWQRDHVFPVVLFSATVSEAIKRDIRRSIPFDDEHVIMDPEMAFPVKENISFGFYKVEDKIHSLTDLIRRGNLININHIGQGKAVDDSDKMLIFSKFRDDTEEYSKAFIKKNHMSLPTLHKYVDYYHAGLSSELRRHKERLFSNQDGERIEVLFATKAFGMGMDIPNIHCVFHTSPPDYIDDYLQEIGRSGRDGKSSSTICLFNDKDARVEDNRALKWEDIENLFSRIKDFFKRFFTNQSIIGKELVIPYCLFDSTDEKDIRKAFSLALNWLSDEEGLIRVKSSCSRPTIVYIKLLRPDKPAINVFGPLFANVYSVIREVGLRYPDTDYYPVEVNELISRCDLSSVSKLLDLLRLGAGRYYDLTQSDIRISLHHSNYRKDEIDEFKSNKKYDIQKLRVLNKALGYLYSREGVEVESLIQGAINADNKETGWRDFYRIALLDHNLSYTTKILTTYVRKDDVVRDCKEIMKTAVEYESKGRNLISIEDFPKMVDPFLCMRFLKNLQYLSDCGLGYDGIEVQLLSDQDIKESTNPMDLRAKDSFDLQLQTFSLRKKCMSYLIKKCGVSSSVNDAWEQRPQIMDFINCYLKQKDVDGLRSLINDA